MLLTNQCIYEINMEVQDCENTGPLNKRQEILQFTNWELLHAIITCGMPILRDIPGEIERRRYELLYKIFLVETALEADGRALKKSDRMSYLDSTEKGMISYYLGMFFTKLISSKRFGVDLLIHFSLMQHSYGEDFFLFEGMKRPDMIGLRLVDDAWSVWEAKGRTNNIQSTFDYGYAQAREIAQINGRPPQMAAVCMTYYENNFLTARVRDPEPEDGGLHLQWNRDLYYSAYYRQISQLFVGNNGDIRCRQDHSVLEDGVAIELPLIPLTGEEEKLHGKRELKIGMQHQLTDLRPGMEARIGELFAGDRRSGSVKDGRGYLGRDLVYVEGI